MPGIDGVDLEVLQRFETGPTRRRVVHDRVGCRLPGILEKVTAEQVASSGQHTNGALRVARNRKNPGVESVLGEIVAVHN